MFPFLVEARFWTLSEEIVIKDTDFAAFKYYERKDEADLLSLASKKSYAETRDYKWYLSNKRPAKLKDSLKELEGILISYKVVIIKWLAFDCVLLVLNSGLLVAVRTNPFTGDVVDIIFDKYLKEKLLSERITDAVITDTSIACCYNDAHLTLIHLSKPIFGNSYKKLIYLEPKITTIELPGLQGRKFYRRLSVNKCGDIIAVWWKCSQDEIYPWSPQVKDVDRANIYIYSIAEGKPELICYHQTEHDLVHVTFSTTDPNVIYCIKQKISRTGEISAENTVYEIVKRSRLQRTSVSSLPLQSGICCAEFSPDRNNLLIGCVDSCVVLYNRSRSLTHHIKAAFIPVVAKWHTDGNVVVILSEQGQIQCFDFALNCIKMQLLSEEVTPSCIIDLSTYFRLEPMLNTVKWCRKTQTSTNNTFAINDSFLLLSFMSGPLTIIRIFGAKAVRPDTLVKGYINSVKVEHAVNLLLALNWDTHPEDCFSALKHIAKHSLSSFSNFNTEKQVHLQTALGSFYSPIQPISCPVQIEYSKRVRNIARIFFHHLLRYEVFDKAFEVATDLNEHDLYMDIYYAAKSAKKTMLATTAWRKAERICVNNYECSSSESNSCGCLCSGCSSSSSNCSSNTDSECSSSLQDSLNFSSSKLPAKFYHDSSSAMSSTPVTSFFPMKQKVKFSNTVTHITLPSANVDSNEVIVNRDVSASEISRVKNASHDLSPLKKEFTKDESDNNEDATTSTVMESSNEQKTIKVVHFGIV